MAKKSLMPGDEPPAPAALEPEPDVAPEDTFTSYKLVDGTVDVATAYYNEQAATVGHPSIWADQLGLELVKAEQHDGFVRITCKVKGAGA